MLLATPARIRKASRSQKGFSLMETLMVVLLLMIVLGVATTGLIQIQKRSNADEGKVDMTQMSRQFLDQIINDLHQSGYPSSKLFDPAAVSANNYAVGLLTVDANTIEFEGDVDGSGNVSHVLLQLLWSNGTPVSSGTGSCPCTLQRGTLYKSQWGTGTVPFYTEVTNVTNTGIFRAFIRDGTEITLPVASTDMLNVSDIKITVNLQSPTPEMDGVTYPTITLASEAKISN